MRSIGRRRTMIVGSAVAAMGLVLTACSSGSSGGESSSSSSSSDSGSASGDCAAYADYMGHEGTTVTMFASILSPESDSLEASWADFSDCTGITIQYEGTNEFESQLPVRVQGGQAPDLAIIPQPGLLARMAPNAVAAPQAVADNVDTYWAAGWKDYATVDGTFYGAPMSANAKSLVWYSPSMFADAGYEVPTTWDDLMALSDQIVADGDVKPWCGGIGSGTATGWPATDWLEQIVLRNSGPDVYDQWVNHDVMFSSPEIKDAMSILEAWMKNPDYVNGGHGDVASIATTTFQDAGLPILQGQCYMLQQASFYAAQWPEGTNVGPDGDVWAFYLPAMNDTYGKPVVGGGEFVVSFADRPEVAAVQTYLSTPEWATSRIEQASGWVSANNGVDPSVYTAPIDQLSAEQLTDPEATFRFDASDLMPSAVGSGAEWTEFTNWFAGSESTDQMLQNIDAAWP
ncbi:ABC transporter substrate-binding protein [Actinotalea sp. M2MS4P-6]|uniref:ABC transporter substrate-binding protein n=1 Tax=Actinotalea sp. M2MS4P-6 TaxID=2983762 RepID=UPI0021E38B4D|nr:ABC transporter substrate-binding protein [Actinotalea sp. M2MS4P-6]MCV2395293.1 ABC transporter substrate-binding protein [Actinotalea sp. M2MS4P-6]